MINNRLIIYYLLFFNLRWKINSPTGMFTIKLAYKYTPIAFSIEYKINLD